MTLQDLENGVLEHFNYRTDDGESVVRLRIRRHLNEWHHRILTIPGLDRLRDATITVASVASTPTVTFGPGVGKILRVYETTNDSVLTLRDTDWYREIDPDPSTGTPTDVVLLGQVAAHTKPASTALYVVSDTAGDTTQQATVDAMTSGGIRVSSTVTLSGTTRVAVQTSAVHVDVSRFVLSAPTTGIISLYNAAAAGTILAQIAPPNTVSRYTQLAFWPTPADAITYTVDYERIVPELALFNEEPLLPIEFHYLLELGARVNEYEKQDDRRQTKAEAHLAEGLRRLMAYVMADRGRVYVPGGTETGRSRLGPWFPRGT